MESQTCTIAPSKCGDRQPQSFCAPSFLDIVLWTCGFKLIWEASIHRSSHSFCLSFPSWLAGVSSSWIQSSFDIFYHFKKDWYMILMSTLLATVLPPKSLYLLYFHNCSQECCWTHVHLDKIQIGGPTELESLIFMSHLDELPWWKFQKTNFQSVWNNGSFSSFWVPMVEW